MHKARSNYNQVRAVLTLEAGSRISLRVQVKPYHAQWDEHTVVHRSSVRVLRLPQSEEETIAYLGRALLQLVELPLPE